MTALAYISSSLMYKVMWPGACLRCSGKGGSLIWRLRRCPTRHGLYKQQEHGCRSCTPCLLVLSWCSVLQAKTAADEGYGRQAIAMASPPRGRSPPGLPSLRDGFAHLQREEQAAAWPG
jgi:hypothetical protein